MNAHLSASEFVDLAAGALDARRARHVESCASCREQSEALGAMLRDAASVDVPEPSPLFWEQFQTRVRGEIAAEPAGGRSGWAWWWGRRGFVPLAAAAAVVVAVFSGVYLQRAGRDGTMPSLTVARPAAVTAAASDGHDKGQMDGLPDPDNAEVWSVLTTAASAVELDDAHDVGMRVQPAAVDRAVQGLSAAELTELGRLLQSELKRSSN